MFNKILTHNFKHKMLQFFTSNTMELHKRILQQLIKLKIHNNEDLLQRKKKVKKKWERRKEKRDVKEYKEGNCYRFFKEMK